MVRIDDDLTELSEVYDLYGDILSRLLILPLIYLAKPTLSQQRFLLELIYDLSRVKLIALEVEVESLLVPQVRHIIILQLYS
jgi:hypothetical protein